MWEIVKTTLGEDGIQAGAAHVGNQNPSEVSAECSRRWQRQKVSYI